MRADIGDEDGFAEELDDDLAAKCAGDFPDADLLGPEGGPGGGEVHIVDAGDQEDEEGDGAENGDAAGIAVLFHFVVEMGMKVDAGQGL